METSPANHSELEQSKEKPSEKSFELASWKVVIGLMHRINEGSLKINRYIADSGINPSALKLFRLLESDDPTAFIQGLGGKKTTSARGGVVHLKAAEQLGLISSNEDEDILNEDFSKVLAANFDPDVEMILNEQYSLDTLEPEVSKLVDFYCEKIDRISSNNTGVSIPLEIAHAQQEALFYIEDMYNDRVKE